MPRPTSTATDGLRAELAAHRERLSELERRIAATDLPAPGRRRGFRLRLAAAVAALALAMPMLTIASDTFGDVPDSNIFHEEINRLYGARVTGGCGGGNYCPDATVTRGQMAAFLNRGLGRMDADDFNISITTETGFSNHTHTSITVRPGNVTGGYALVLVWGSMYFSYSSGSCPCNLATEIDYDGTRLGGSSVYFNVYSTGASDGNYFPVTIMRTAIVPTGVDATFELITQEYGNTAGSSIDGEGTFGAVVIPFGGSGEAVSPFPM